jgi:hypothetical protein
VAKRRRIRQGSIAIIVDQDVEALAQYDLAPLDEGLVMGHLSFFDDMLGEYSWMSLVRFEHGDYWMYPDQIENKNAYLRGLEDNGN